MSTSTSTIDLRLCVTWYSTMYQVLVRNMTYLYLYSAPFDIRGEFLIRACCKYAYVNDIEENSSEVRAHVKHNNIIYVSYTQYHIYLLSTAPSQIVLYQGTVQCTPSNGFWSSLLVPVQCSCTLLEYEYSDTEFWGRNSTTVQFITVFMFSSK